MGTYPYSSSPYDRPSLPQPPRLHWGWVLALSVLTRSYFNSIWLVVQAHWVKRLTGRTEAFWWCIANLCVLPALAILGFAVGLTIAVADPNRGDPKPLIVIAELIGGAIALFTYCKAAFTLRRELESAPIGIALGGVMTFFFSSLYFQYWLRDYVLPSPDYSYGTVPTPVFLNPPRVP